MVGCEEDERICPGIIRLPEPVAFELACQPTQKPEGRAIGGLFHR
jgi:hypothetical protein